MKKHLIAVAAALILGGLGTSTAAKADEVRLFATASFGDTKQGFGSAEYGWGSDNSIFTLGASLFVANTGTGANAKSEFDIGLNGGYTYLFTPDANTGFLEGRAGSFDVSNFSDKAFYEISAGYRWYVSDRAAIGWNILGWEQRKTLSFVNGRQKSEFDGNAFTRLQLIIALD